MMEMYLTEDEELSLKKACDKMKALIKSGRPQFTLFLNPKIVMRLKSMAKKKENEGILFSFFGGYEDAQRQICAFSYEEIDREEFPMTPLKITGRNISDLSHRDYLGSLIGLGITRDVLGDILINEDGCFVFVLSDMIDFVMQNLVSVGKCSVSAEEVPLNAAFRLKQQYRTVTGTVASFRLDAVLSMLTGFSRGKAEELIRSEKVFLNYTPCTNVSKNLREGDVLSVRGFGKAKLAKVGGQSRKGRYFITMLQYQ